MIFFGYISSLAVAVVLALFYMGNVAHHAVVAFKSNPQRGSFFYVEVDTKQPTPPTLYVAFTVTKDSVTKALLNASATRYARVNTCSSATALYRYTTNHSLPPLTLYLSELFSRPPPFS